MLWGVFHHYFLSQLPQPTSIQIHVSWGTRLYFLWRDILSSPLTAPTRMASYSISRACVTNSRPKAWKARNPKKPKPGVSKIYLWQLFHLINVRYNYCLKLSLSYQRILQIDKQKIFLFYIINDHFSTVTYPQLVENMASETTFDNWKVVFWWGKARKTRFSQNPLNSRFSFFGFLIYTLSCAKLKKSPVTNFVSLTPCSCH